MKNRNLKETPEGSPDELGAGGAPPSPAGLRIPEDRIAECCKLMRRVSRESPIRRVAEQIVAGAIRSDPPVSELIASVTSKSGWRWRERRLAAWLLGEVVPVTHELDPAVIALYDVVIRAWKRYTPRENMISCLVGSGIVTVLAGACWAYGHFVDGLQGWPLREFVANSMLTTVALTMPILMVCLLAYRLVDARRTNAIREMAIRSLGKLAVPQTLGILAMAASEPYGRPWNGSGAIRMAASEALPKIVAALEPAHYGALPAGTVSWLCKLLGDGSSYAAFPALDALRVIGDGSAVQPVARLARRAADPAVRRTAEELLPILQERQKQAQAAAGLLRPAEALAAAPEELLRPAAGSADESPEELLRASDGEAPGDGL
jgi:hypothetical protein